VVACECGRDSPCPDTDSGFVDPPRRGLDGDADNRPSDRRRIDLQHLRLAVREGYGVLRDRRGAHPRFQSDGKEENCLAASGADADTAGRTVRTRWWCPVLDSVHLGRGRASRIVTVQLSARVAGATAGLDAVARLGARPLLAAGASRLAVLVDWFVSCGVTLQCWAQRIRARGTR